MLAAIKHIVSKPSTHYVVFFSFGAGLEIFMNLFHIGDISIYRTIKRNLSNARAEEQFEREKALFESISSSNDVEA